jgi:hypothetical protein
MTDHGCSACRSAAAELALGLLTGRERADALAHLERCPACHAHVEGLARVHDALQALPPAHDPPAGFESRVLARLPRRRPRRRRYALVGVAAAALVGLGWATGALTAPPALRTVAVTAGGHDLGQAFAHPGEPSWLYMYLDLDKPVAGPVTCTVIRTDGTRAVVGTFTVADGDAYWGGPVEAGRLAAVEVTDTTGAVVATARFP